MTRALTIGLTGGVASGKTTVAALFAALGVPLLEGDDVGRAVVVPPSPALAAIEQQFGPEFLLPDGTLNRRRMRERVFADPPALRALEAITHPLIRSRIAEWQQAQAAPYCILSAAILVESKLDRLVDRVLVVDVPAALQIERVKLRDAVPESLARQMLQAQAERGARLNRADDVIENSGPAADLSAAVRRLHALYLQISTGQLVRATGGADNGTL